MTLEMSSNPVQPAAVETTPEATSEVKSDGTVIELPGYSLDALVGHACQTVHVYKNRKYLEPQQFSKPKEQATLFSESSLTDEEKIKLVHAGYLVVTPMVFKVWQESQGTMRGTMTLAIDRGYVVFHGKDEAYQDALADLEVEKVSPYSEKAKQARPENTYQVRGSSDNVFVVSLKSDTENGNV